ncbi:MAG: NAD(P)-dependent oxidoreductase [Candidatus Limnocylindria bacterium]
MRILVASSIDDRAVEYLSSRHDVVFALNADEDRIKSLIGDRQVLVFRSGVRVSAAVLGCAPQLRTIIRAGSGLDNLDLEEVRRRGISLERIPGPGAQAVAELSFGLMLALARQIMLADRLLRQGHWAKGEVIGHLLVGKTLGVIGVGNIGGQVARLGAAWGMRVIGCVESPSSTRAQELADAGIELMDCAAVLREADFVSVHVPLKESSHRLIDAAALATMKPGAFLVNMARGGVVDEEALHRELTTEGRLAGAGLDVHEQEGEGKISPLAALPNVILTPHIGATTIDSQREIGREIVRIIRALEGNEKEGIAK